MECYTFLRQASHCGYFLAARRGAQGRWSEQQRRYPRKSSGSWSDKSCFGVTYGASDYRYKTNWGNSAVLLMMLMLLLWYIYRTPLMRLLAAGRGGALNLQLIFECALVHMHLDCIFKKWLQSPYPGYCGYKRDHKAAACNVIFTLSTSRL